MASSSDRNLTDNENCQLFTTSSSLSAKQKRSQSKQYKTKFNSAWLGRYKSMRQHDDFSGKCMICNEVVRVEHQEERNLIRHMNTESHKKNANEQKTNAKMNFAPAKSAVDEKVSKI